MNMNLARRALRSRFALSVCLVLLPLAAKAEFPTIEPLAAKIADQAAPLLKEESVIVAARPSEPTAGPWPVHEAFAVDLTAALRERDVEAARSIAHPATASLSNGTRAFSDSDVARIKAADADVLAAVKLSARARKLEVRLLPADGSKPLGEFTLDLPAEVFDQNANIPEFNQKVVAFCRGKLGSMCGDGICATLAGDALKAAGAKRSGIYTWGRELDATEPVLPGDILQLELVKLKGKGFNRHYEHHTAIVEEVRPDAVIVLQQNAPPSGKVVQRETWPISLARSGRIQAFRPWDGESPLPPVSPRRREDPRIVRRGSTIDLLQTLDPQLDSIKGMWFRDGGLKWNRDTYARLQVPVTPPENYTLRLKIRRLFGSDQFGIGLIVGGRQVLLSIDAYGGKTTNLHLLDRKKSKDAPGVHHGSVLPSNRFVDLVVRVRRDSVQLAANGETIIDWHGDPKRLSMDSLYAVPRTDWLFLASWNTQFELTEYTLEEDAATKGR